MPGQRPLKDLDHDPLQRTAKTKLFAESRDRRHDHDIDDRVEWMMHFQESVLTCRRCPVPRFDHPLAKRNMFVQFTQPFFQRKRKDAAARPPGDKNCCRTAGRSPS